MVLGLSAITARAHGSKTFNWHQVVGFSGPDLVAVTQVTDAPVGKEAWRLRPLVEEQQHGLWVDVSHVLG